MDKSRPADAVDRILEQWKRERPDLDCSPMGPIGRLKRCAMLLEPQIEAAFIRHDLVRWEFDMLATLRRAGAPFILSPTQLFSTLMITSGTMTHRLKALEKRGFISRLPDPNDARSMLVALTPEGRERIDSAVETHVENERQLLAGLTTAQRQQLDQSLALLMRLLETR
ncbi:MarR family winged helix-turn-helix transcriptional regulator [Klebsiella sp. R390]|uniref:MarR family winged helix-turn-helix transcriptional regulator n=1 Tax=Klebsiella sp. R390 TaxID=2755400 RepID=UPI003DA7AD63